ncbi:MAG: carboxypeptidase-like regulatory domain-containing protein [Draconibacterium sp.]|nr:carboxypeptidase-like regulatory domain-containing protein [Draconibacterium sp.]
MRKFFLLIALIILQMAAYCQVINGTIIDSKTDSTICFATIYFNGTFVGTSSDINGNFKLDISKMLQ